MCHLPETNLHTAKQFVLMTTRRQTKRDDQRLPLMLRDDVYCLDERLCRAECSVSFSVKVDAKEPRGTKRTLIKAGGIYIVLCMLAVLCCVAATAILCNGAVGAEIFKCDIVRIRLEKLPAEELSTVRQEGSSRSTGLDSDWPMDRQLVLSHGGLQHFPTFLAIFAMTRAKKKSILQ